MEMITKQLHQEESWHQVNDSTLEAMLFA